MPQQQTKRQCYHYNHTTNAQYNTPTFSALDHCQMIHRRPVGPAATASGNISQIIHATSQNHSVARALKLETSVRNAIGGGFSFYKRAKTTTTPHHSYGTARTEKRNEDDKNRRRRSRERERERR